MAAMIECQLCGQMLELEGAYPGRQIVCPICGGAFPVPGGAAAAPVQRAAPAVASRVSWHVALGSGERYGPVDEPTLIAWIREGRVDAAASVWRSGMKDWSAITAVEVFRRELPRSTPAARGPAISPGVARSKKESSKRIKWFVVGSAGLIVLSFLLPWFDVGIVKLSGFDFARLARVVGREAQDTESSTAAVMLFLIPLFAMAGGAAIVAGYSRGPAVAFLCACGAAGITAVFVLRPVLQADVSSEVFDVLGIGFYGNLLGCGGMLVTSIVALKE